MGILAWHAQSYSPLLEWPFVIEGTKSMPVIWLFQLSVSLFSVDHRCCFAKTSGVYFIMITLALRK